MNMIGFNYWDQIYWTDEQLAIFAKYIARFRMILEWDQTELAKRLGLSRQSISAFETGRILMRKPVMFGMLYIFKQEMSRINDTSFDDPDKARRYKAESQIYLMSSIVEEFSKEIGIENESF